MNVTDVKSGQEGYYVGEPPSPPREELVSIKTPQKVKEIAFENIQVDPNDTLNASNLTVRCLTGCDSVERLQRRRQIDQLANEALNPPKNAIDPFLPDSCKITKDRRFRAQEKREEEVPVEDASFVEKQQLEPQKWSLSGAIAEFFRGVLSDFRGL